MLCMPFAPFLKISVTFYNSILSISLRIIRIFVECKDCLFVSKFQTSADFFVLIYYVSGTAKWIIYIVACAENMRMIIRWRNIDARPMSSTKMKDTKNRIIFFQKNVWKRPSPSVNRLNRLIYRPLRHWWSTEGLGCFCLFPCIHRFLGWFYSRYRIFYRRIRLSGFISTMVGMHVILSIHWYRMMVWQISEILVKQLVLSCKLSCFMLWIKLFYIAKQVVSQPYRYQTIL